MEPVQETRRTRNRRTTRRTAKGNMKFMLGLAATLALVLILSRVTSNILSSRGEGVRVPDTGGPSSPSGPEAGPGADGDDPTGTGTEPDGAGAGPDGTGAGQTEPDEPSAGSLALTEEQLSLLKVNEAGKVMVIMYHDVSEKEAEWVRTRANFRADLERFHNLGYSLVLFSDFLRGNVDVPLGRTPLIFTFDDGTRGQLRLIEQDGAMVADPDSAIGMMLEFSESHPDFGHAATFYITSTNPFGSGSQAGEYLQFVLDNGMEIGNHTWTHADLSVLSPAEVRAEIGRYHNYIEDLCGYGMVSLALPYGGYPKSSENLMSGEWEGRKYDNLGILLVGAEPAPSPFSGAFRPQAIPRIRGSQPELDKWLTNFEKYPETKFVSDGLADTVTVPVSELSRLSEDRLAGKEVRSYEIQAPAD